MPRTLWAVIPVVLLLTGVACAHGRSGTVAPTGTPVRVEVINHYTLPMEIYAVGAGITHRMGLVNPGMSGSYTIPSSLIGGASVELQAQPPAGGQTFKSGPLLLSPGAVVDLELTMRLFNSTATIRP